LTEIYKNTSQNVSLVITGDEADATPTATLVKGETETPLTVSPGDPLTGAQAWKAYIGLTHTQEESAFKVVWQFTINSEQATKTDWFEVVTPLVSVSRAREELEIPDSISDDKIRLTERKVRRIIERYCGQKFGLNREKVVVRGDGTDSIRLVRRLHKLVSMDDSTWPVTVGGIEIRNNGFLLKRTRMLDHGVITGSVPIESPYNPHIWTFPTYREYVIDGYWGYERVPSEIQEAALILIEQELCPETVYRERFIDNVASADFRYNVNEMAFLGTGNVTADALLQEFIMNGASLV